MENNEVRELKALIEMKEAEIELNKIQLKKLKNKLFHTEWEYITWDDLEAWLKDNRPENNYEKNPSVVPNTPEDFEWALQNSTYCKLIKTNLGIETLQVGPYLNDDRIKRHTGMYVRRDKKAYR